MGCTRNVLMSTGMLVKVWKKVNSVKHEKILVSWKKIILTLYRNKLLTKKTNKNFKRPPALLRNSFEKKLSYWRTKEKYSLFSKVKIILWKKNFLCTLN